MVKVSPFFWVPFLPSSVQPVVTTHSLSPLLTMSFRMVNNMWLYNGNAAARVVGAKVA